MFLRVYWLLFLIPIGFGLWRLYAKGQGNSVWQSVCDKHLLSHLMVSTGKSKHLPFILLIIFLIISIIAISGPSWRKIKTPVFQSTETTVVLLDLSESMMAQDIKPNRLSRAKYKLEDLLKFNKERRFALAVFSNESFTVSPVTTDSATLSTMIPVLGPEILPVAGRDVSQALMYAHKLLKQSGQPKGNILLITTGGADTSAIKTAKNLNKQGVNISVLGVGTITGAPITTDEGFVKDKTGNIIMSKLDEDSLSELASVGGGSYHKMTNDAEDIESLSNQWLTKFNESKDRLFLDINKDDGYWLMFLIVALGLLAFRPGWWHAIIG